MRATWTLFFACMLLSVSKAKADEAELQVSAAPVFSLVSRYGNVNHGAGGALMVRYGLRDNIFVEGSFACDRLNGLRDDSLSYNQVSAKQFYDATRCFFVPSLGYERGRQLRYGASVGLGYRMERHSDQSLVAAENILIEEQDATWQHAMVARLAGHIGYRFGNEITLFAFTTVTRPLWGDLQGFEYVFGGAVGFSLYPMGGS